MPPGPESPAEGEPGPGTPPAGRRRLAAAAWLAGGLALTVLLVRISLTARVMSDGGNNALQAWDLLHGHLLLHGWQIGDANYYFLELPLMALAEAIFGLGDLAQHVSSALTYALITAAAAAIAVTGSRGAARAVRGAAVLAVMAAPLFAGTTFLVLEEPDHTGTSLFILGSVLLIDRLPARRLTAPLLLVILTAGQFEDLTVRYVAVPAIAAVCAYRALAARSLRSPDTLLAGHRPCLGPPVSAVQQVLGAHRRVHHRPRRGADSPPLTSGRIMCLSPWRTSASCSAGHPWRASYQAGKATSAWPARWPGRSASRGWRGGGAARAGPNS